MSINKQILKKLINKGTVKELVNPEKILIEKFEINDDFWSQHNESLDRYQQLILNYNKALQELKEKGSLNHLSLNNPIHKAYQVFHGSEPIRVIKYNNKYYFNGAGRHRILAAQILKKKGYDVKIFVETSIFVDDNNVNNNKSSAMSYEIERQIELLKEAKNVFYMNAQNLKNLIDMFNTAIRSFDQDGLNHDYQEFLEEFRLEYNNHLKQLVKDLEDEYIPTIQKKIEYLEDRI